MTVKECYEQMGADYEGLLSRLGSEALIKKFAVKFLADGSFQDLKTSLEAGEAEQAFRAAHTLKGICLNLGFDNLYKPSEELTELLRGREIVPGSQEKFAEVEAEYNKTVAAIQGLACSLAIHPVVLL